MWDWLKTSKTTHGKPETKAAPDKSTEPVPTETPEFKIIIITGTSGSGRKATAKKLSTDLGIPYVLSYTTRAKRPNEQDGEHYHFVSTDEFQAMAGREEFYETVTLERGRYGVSKNELNQALEKRKAAIIVLNWDGVQTFRREFGQGAIRIFLYVTKDDIRLRQEREAAPPEVLEEYLRNYPDQVMHKKESDYLLQNIDPSVTVDKIKAFLHDKL